MVRLLAERSDTKSNIKFDGFRSQSQTSYVSSRTEELWYNETVCLWMTIYIYLIFPICFYTHVYRLKDVDIYRQSATYKEIHNFFLQIQIYNR